MVSLAYAPFFLALAALALLASAPFSNRVHRFLGRVSLRAFGSYVRREARASASATRADRTQALHAARFPTTYRLYAARTLLYAGITAIAGSVLGVYLAVEVVNLLNVPAEQLRALLPGPMAGLADVLAVPTFSVTQAFALLLVSSATVGVGTAVTVHQFRWWWPRSRADARARKVEASMERTVAFLYALSRSGMSFPEVLRIVDRNQDVYGEAAREFELVVREVDMFGADIHEALQHLSERTPSDEFSDFCDNLGSVLRSGRDLGNFLRDQHEQLQSESRARQSQFLDMLSTIAEAYVTVFVAGPLFMLTILVIVGLLVGGTQAFIAVSVYVLVPLATFGVLVYLDSLSVSGGVEPDPSTVDDEDFGGFGDIGRRSAATTDGGFGGGTAANTFRLTVHRRSRWAKDFIRNPIQNVLERPVSLFGVTVPVAVAYLLWVLWPWVSTQQLPPLGVLDDPLVHATLFVVGTFSVAHEVRQRQLRAIERAVPDFLERLASINEAGMPIAESLGQIVTSDVGALNRELSRTWTDVQWGARIETALQRFDRRVRSVAVTRAVTLITNALRASGDVGPVLRIAADEAQASRRLARQRRQEMMTYLVVIYVSYFVFLAIVVSLNVYFMPNVPTAEQFSGELTGQLGSFGNLTEAEKDAYSQLFFHASLVQAVCSGAVAGLMGENDLAAGAKHATVMLAVGYVVFVGLA